MLGEVLIGGMASLLMVCFLGPKFIEVIRNREFGQQIREEGPAGHHGKAGTPTMGGIIMFIAVTVPFLILSAPDYDGASLAVLGCALANAGLGLVDDWTKVVEEALARPARAHQDRLPAAHLDRALAGRDAVGRARLRDPLPHLRRAASTSGSSTRSSSSWCSAGRRTA